MGFLADVFAAAAGHTPSFGHPWPSAVPETTVVRDDKHQWVRSSEGISQVWSDGHTVWVDVNGFTVGRFSKFGIDVHTADASGCIDCTHEIPTRVDWDRFTAGMLEHHKVDVPDWFMPRFLR